MEKILPYNKDCVAKIQTTRYVYKRVNGQELALEVAYPNSTTPTACIMFIHGGGWRNESLKRLLPHAQYAAQNGMVGVSISYRFIDEEKEIDVRDGLADCLDALAFIRRLCQETYGDLRIIAAGDSAGGYYAACLGCKQLIARISVDAERVDCVVDWNGIVDLTSKWSYGIIKKSADEQDKAELEKQYSPLYAISKGDAPVYIVHGDKDKTVALTDAIAYQKALLASGVQCQLQILQGAMHAFILFDYHHENEYVASVLKDTLLWLKENKFL